MALIALYLAFSALFWAVRGIYLSLVLCVYFSFRGCVCVAYSSSIIMKYVVVLGGFSYDDLCKIAKDFDVPISVLQDVYKHSKTAKDFESAWESLG